MPITLGLLSGGGGGAVGVSSMDYVATGSGNTSGVTASFGAEAVNRYIVIAVGIRISATASSLRFSGATIGGVTATLLDTDAAVAISNGTTRVVGLFGALVPTGTTGDVIFTMSNGNNYGGMDWSSYRLIGDNVQLWANASWSGSSANLGTIPDKCAVIAVSESESGGTAITWTNLTRNIEKDKGNWRYSSASKYFSASQALTISCGSGVKVGAVLYSP